MRYRYKACGRIFITASSPMIRHRKPYRKDAIFHLLVNKVPSHRICEVEEITMSTLYRKMVCRYVENTALWSLFISY